MWVNTHWAKMDHQEGAIMKQYYDKLLHILVTFALVAFLERAGLSIVYAFWIIYILQWGKVIRNRRQDSSYRMVGDWIANIIGYILAGGFLAIPH